jgi:DNA-binding response OmpR family regulator
MMRSPPHFILVVDDEASVREAIQQVLNQLSEIEVHMAASKQEAIVMLDQHKYDLLLADVVMEDTTAGLALLEIVKQCTSETSVILLTGNATVDIAVAALRLGAEDFLIKPSSAKEIKMRVLDALKRRDEIVKQRELLTNIADTLHALSGGASEIRLQQNTQPASASDGRYLIIGALTLDQHTHQVIVHGNAIDITPTEYAILRALGDARGRALAFDEIIGTVHGYNVERDEARDMVRPHIRNLRLKLGNASKYLHNVRGYGYYLAQA